jgi:1,4-alpha-glucan branching enzyme
MVKKKFFKTKCKVTFELPVDVEGGQDVYLVGEFNDWNAHATKLRKKGSSFAVTLDLDRDREYQYRYLIDETTWRNDQAADRYVPNPFNGENSVVSTFGHDRVQ